MLDAFRQRNNEIRPPRRSRSTRAAKGADAGLVDLGESDQGKARKAPGRATARDAPPGLTAGARSQTEINPPCPLDLGGRQ